MIKGMHAMFYSAEAEALRAFLRDKLQFPCTDVGEGWLIFDLPEADLGCHPADPEGKHGAPAGTHDVSFYCDNIEATVEELKGRGVEFTGGIEDRGYGLVTHFLMPGDMKVQLYQPRYAKHPSRS
jgi:catechol 2,3-dioxygenase-like lactoylglutathione lyase family enzyme